MPTYKKPQSPLYSKENDAYFYPLTTSDQVILPNGERLTQKGLEQLITPEGIGAEPAGAMRMELLWENASPTSEFAAQTISLDLSGYNLIVIEYRRAYNIERTLFGIHNAIGGGAMTDGYTNVDNELQNVSRLLSASTTGITFNGSNRQYADEKARVDHNGYLVPIKIYGIKGVSA